MDKIRNTGVNLAQSRGEVVPRDFAAMLLLARGCSTKDLHAKLVELHNSHSDKRINWLDTFREGSRFANIDDLRKTLSELRKKLQSAGFANAETLVPLRGNPVTFPMARIMILDNIGMIDVIVAGRE